MRLELDAKQEVMQSLQETAHHLCRENHPAKQTVEVNLSLDLCGNCCTLIAFFFKCVMFCGKNVDFIMFSFTAF